MGALRRVGRLVSTGVARPVNYLFRSMSAEAKSPYTSIKRLAALLSTYKSEVAANLAGRLERGLTPGEERDLDRSPRFLDSTVFAALGLVKNLPAGSGGAFKDEKVIQDLVFRLSTEYVRRLAGQKGVHAHIRKVAIQKLEAEAEKLSISIWELAALQDFCQSRVVANLAGRLERGLTPLEQRDITKCAVEDPEFEWVVFCALLAVKDLPTDREGAIRDAKFIKNMIFQLLLFDTVLGLAEAKDVHPYIEAMAIQRSVFQEQNVAKLSDSNSEYYGEKGGEIRDLIYGHLQDLHRKTHRLPDGETPQSLEERMNEGTIFQYALRIHLDDCLWGDCPRASRDFLYSQLGKVFKYLDCNW